MHIKEGLKERHTLSVTVTNEPGVLARIAGMFTARGYAVVVVDARQPDARAETGFDGRAYALSIASKRLLGAIGVWGDLADKVQPILQIKASDGVAGQRPAPFFLTFDHAEIEEGPMGFMAEDRHLYAAFLAAMRAADWGARLAVALPPLPTGPACSSVTLAT